jgi:hypothetical protein
MCERPTPAPTQGGSHVNSKTVSGLDDDLKQMLRELEEALGNG